MSSGANPALGRDAQSCDEWLSISESLTDEPSACIRHQDCEGEHRGLERPGPRVGQGLGDAHSFDRLNFVGIGAAARRMALPREEHVQGTLDRKSTRLNSSHVAISYAVFCLKKKRPVI